MSFLKSIKQYASYEEIFGEKYNRDQLIQRIQELPARQMLNIIVQLSEFPSKAEDPDIRNDFIGFLTAIAAKRNAEDFFRKKLIDRILYTPQSLLSLCKWLLAYGNFSDSVAPIDSNKGIRAVVYLSIIISDYMTTNDKELLPYDIVRNYSFNKGEDLATSIARTLFILRDIASNKDLFPQDEYMDLNQDFQNIKHYSIADYAAFLFAMFAYFNNAKKIINPLVSYDINAILEPTALRGKIPFMMDGLIFPISEAQKWARDTISEQWNFSKFWEKPFLALTDGKYIPILPRMLYRNFFLTMKIVTSKIYSRRDREKYNGFFGRPFESYVQYLLQHSVNRDRYEYYEEKEYSGNRSPDGMIRFGNKLLAIEAKAKYLRKESIFFNTKAEVEKDIDRLIIEPIIQLNDRLAEMILINRPYDLSGVTDIYFMSVTMGGMPAVPPLESKIQDIFNGCITLPIKGWFHLDIEEFESFCEMLQRPNGKSIFRILDNYFKSDTNFMNFAANTGLYPRRPKVSKDIYNSKIREIAICLGYNPDSLTQYK